MHLLYYRHSDGEREYVVFTEDDAVDAEDHEKPGYTLTARADISDAQFELGRDSMLPTDQPLNTEF